MNFRIWTLLTITLALSLNAHARPRMSSAAGGGGSTGLSDQSSWYIEETLFPEYVLKNDTTSVPGAPGVASESGLGLDARTTLGFAYQNRYFLGVSYNIYSLTTKRDNVAGGSSGLKESTTRDEWGPTVGFMYANWRVMLTYFTGGSKKVGTRNFDATSTTGDVTFKNTSLSGFQLVTGYTFRLGGTFEIGPTLVYRSVSYAKQSKTNRLNASEDYASTKLFSKAVDNKLTPMVTMAVRF